VVQRLRVNGVIARFNQSKQNRSASISWRGGSVWPAAYLYIWALYQTSRGTWRCPGWPM